VSSLQRFAGSLALVELVHRRSFQIYVAGGDDIAPAATRIASVADPFEPEENVGGLLWVIGGCGPLKGSERPANDQLIGCAGPENYLSRICQTR
jgi:hypothetical protein